MRSGTSYFNGTLFQKAFKRFWPIWTLYLGIWVILIPLRLFSQAMQWAKYTDPEWAAELLQESAQSIPGFLSMGVWLAFAFGVGCAMAMFGYLYTSRSACMMHALPVRRESLFLTHYLAGLSFLLGGNLVVFGLTVAVEAGLGCLAVGQLVQWLLIQSGTCLFFYSFAVFCAMFTGSMMALPIFYGILNGLAAGVTGLVDLVCTQFLYGFTHVSSATAEVVEWLTPMMKLSIELDAYMNEQGDLVLINPGSAVAYAVAYAVAGIVLAVAALLVYRTRHIESAGDVVAVKAVRPIFQYGLALCVGLSGGIFTSTMLYSESKITFLIWVVLWSVVGYFAGAMFLKKSFHVLSAWKGAVVLGGVVAVLCLSVCYDWYGYGRYVPAADQVQEVEVVVRSVPYDSGDGSLTIRDPKEMTQVMAIHQQILDRNNGILPSERSDEDQYLHITYTLNNGRTVTRSYHSVPLYESQLEQEGSLEYLLQNLLNQREHVRELYRFDDMSQCRVLSATVVDVWDSQTKEFSDISVEDKADQLWAAVKQDMEEGTLGVRYLLETSDVRLKNTCSTDLRFELVPAGSEKKAPAMESEASIKVINWSITLTPQATHTMEALRQLGVLDGTHLAPTKEMHNQLAEYEDNEFLDTELDGDGRPVTMGVVG